MLTSTESNNREALRLSCDTQTERDWMANIHSHKGATERSAVGTLNERKQIYIYI